MASIATPKARGAAIALLVVLVAATTVYVATRENPPFHDLGPALARAAAVAAEGRGAEKPPDTLVDLDFTRDADRARVRALPGAEPEKAGTSGARFKIREEDNRVAIDLPEWTGGGRDARGATLLLLELGVTKAHDVTTLYWAAPDQPSHASRSAPIPLPYDGKLHALVVPLEDSPEWRGEIGRLEIRLGTEPQDLAAAEAPVLTVRSLRLLRTTLSQRFTIESKGVAASARPGLRPIRLGGETRSGLLAGAPSGFACDVDVPELRPKLEGAVGLHGAAFGRYDSTVTFRVTADDETVFEREVDPRNPADRGWIEFRADLAPFAGRSARLAYTIECAPEVGGYALLARPVVYGDREDDARLGGVVLVSLDTLRADRLSCYGPPGPPATTPALDALAAESARFESAFSAAPETIAAHMSLFTAMTPRVHNIIDAGRAIDGDVTLLAERFAEAGYATAAFTEGGNVGAAFGFWQGFDRYVETERGARGEKRIEETVAAAEAWLATHRDRPFFLFVHTYEAHTPYDPPEALRRLVDPDYAGPYETNVSWPLVADMLIGTQPATERDFDHVRRLYDAGVRHVDVVMGGFFERLRASGALDRAVLAVTSDHGEDFFDHFGFATHGHSLYDELIHVPLLVRGPGITPRVVNELVSTVSLGPTLLEVAGLPPFPSDSVRRVQGRSFAPLLHGRALESPPEFLVADDETFFKRLALRFATEKIVFNETIEQPPGPGEDPAGGAVLAGDIKRVLAMPHLAWAGVREKADGWLREVELYDLRADPREQRNLAAERPDAVAAYLLKSQVYRKSLPPPLIPQNASLSAEDLARLAALGYIDKKPK